MKSFSGKQFHVYMRNSRLLYDPKTLRKTKLNELKKKTMGRTHIYALGTRPSRIPKSM